MVHVAEDHLRKGTIAVVGASYTKWFYQNWHAIEKHVDPGLSPLAGALLGKTRGLP